MHGIKNSDFVIGFGMKTEMSVLTRPSVLLCRSNLHGKFYAYPSIYIINVLCVWFCLYIKHYLKGKLKMLHVYPAVYLSGKIV